MRQQRPLSPIDTARHGGRSEQGYSLPFVVASGALIFVLVVASGLGVGWFFERSALSRERALTGNAVQTLAQRRLAPADFKLSGAPEPKRFEAFREILGIFRVKVFDQSGRVVWSDEPRLIGQRFPDNPHLKKAMTGQVAMVLEAPTRDEHLYEFARGYVAESYIPITFPASPGVVGVIETYRDVTEAIRDIRRTQRLIWGFAGAGGLLLYVILGVVVWGSGVKQVAHT